MRLIINGMERHVTDNLTVAGLLELDGEPADHVLVEVDGIYVPPRLYASFVLQDGHRVEIILPAFGG